MNMMKQKKEHLLKNFPMTGGVLSVMHQRMPLKRFAEEVTYDKDRKEST